MEETLERLRAALLKLAAANRAIADQLYGLTALVDGLLGAARLSQRAATETEQLERSLRQP